MPGRRPGALFAQESRVIIETPFLQNLLPVFSRSEWRVISKNFPFFSIPFPADYRRVLKTMLPPAMLISGLSFVSPLG